MSSTADKMVVPVSLYGRIRNSNWNEGKAPVTSLRILSKDSGTTRSGTPTEMDITISSGDMIKLCSIFEYRIHRITFHDPERPENIDNFTKDDGQGDFLLSYEPIYSCILDNRKKSIWGI